MADDKSLQQLLTDINAAGTACMTGEPGARARLITQLSTAQRELEGPGLYQLRVRLTPLVNICQLIAIETHMLEPIVQANGKPVTAHDISNVVHQDEQLIVRIMRLLTASGFSTEVAPATYTSNPLAELLIKPATEGAVRNNVELMFPLAASVVKQLRFPAGLAQFSDDGAGVTPFRSKYGNMSMFDFFETNPEHKAHFDHYMAGRSAGTRRAWYNTYPVRERLLPGSDIEDQDGKVLVVDVGGGQGHKLAGFRRAFPEAKGRLVLQDLASTVRTLPSTLPARIETQPHDFFTPQPVLGARAYFLSAILHDWSDAKACSILRHVADAMTPGYSKLIVEELILADQGEGFRGAAMDMLMLMMVEGVERSMGQWRDMFESVRLRISGVWRSVDGSECIMECEKVAHPS